MLEPPKKSNTSFYHTNPNHSTLEWPSQPSPGQIAWKQWKDAITWIYAQPNSITLQQLLGPWLTQYDQDYKWTWLMHPPTQNLYHCFNQQWHVYRPIRQTTTFIEYPARPMVSHQLPDISQLAMPTLQPGCIRLTLLLPNCHYPQPQLPQPDSTLLQRLHTPPQKWLQPLWHTINRHAPIGQLKQAILTKQPIILVSDTLVSPRQMGTCAWVIWSATQLWSGEGIVPSTNKDIYSGLTEAYGILTVLSYFQNYLSSFPIIIPPATKIQLYCDNQGILDCIQANEPIYPCDTIQDDYPIIREIQILIQTIQPITVHLHHVTGHQDEKKLKRPLTTQETLNIKCDHRATTLNNTLIDHPASYHPSLPASYPHLQIDQHTTIRQLQSKLREAATHPDYYHHYLCKKFDWDASIPDKIQWQVFRIAYH